MAPKYCSLFLKRSTQKICISCEIAGVYVHPGDVSGPLAPDRGTERAAGTQPGPPPTGLQHAADNVVLTVTVKVADVDINPGDGGGPSVPDREIERAAGTQSRPPSAGLLHAAGNVFLAVAIEIADVDI